MIINHKKLNQTPKKNYEIVLHAMHCGGEAVGILFLKTFTYQLKLVIFRGGASNWLPVQKPPCIKTPKREVGECVSDTFF